MQVWKLFFGWYPESFNSKRYAFNNCLPARQMNAHCERYNRTLQEEFVLFHEELLLDVDAFNHQLADWLYWYNCERPHRSLKMKTPMQKIREYWIKKIPESNLGWDHTLSQINPVSLESLNYNYLSLHSINVRNY